MAEFVLTTQDGETALNVLTSVSALRKQFSRVSFPKSGITDELLAAHGLPARVLVDAPRPALAGGESTFAQPEKQVDGSWLKVWTKTRITLAQAKARLAQDAIKLYQTKVQTVTPGEVLSAGLLGAWQANETTYKPHLDTFAAAVQAASTVDECYTLYQQLQEWGA